MILVLIRITAVVIGTSLFLPSFALVAAAMMDKVWEAAFLAAITGLAGAWLISAGWYGTWSGQPPKIQSSESARLPNTR
jgi:formate hydrogenlyase subunit 3/multisubunit Na+/H+ antiporter MnhD subunit